MIRDKSTVLEGLSKHFYIMLFNEPDLPFPAGSDMTIDEVVELTKEVTDKYPEKTFVSPGYSHRGYRDLVKFWNAYRERYGEVPIDILAMHCYYSVDGCINLAGWYIHQCDELGLDPCRIWVTEIGWPCEGECQSVRADMTEFLQFAKDLPEIERVAWFIHSDSVDGRFHAFQLIDVLTNKLTPLGREFKEN